MAQQRHANDAARRRPRRRRPHAQPRQDRRRGDERKRGAGRRDRPMVIRDSSRLSLSRRDRFVTGIGVEIEVSLARKAHQRDTGCSGRIDGQRTTARSPRRSRQSPRPRPFARSRTIARPLTKRPRPVRGQLAVEQQLSDHLVDGVVAPDVLAHDRDRARRESNTAAAWTAPVFVEQRLLAVESRRDVGEHADRDVASRMTGGASRAQSASIDSLPQRPQRRRRETEAGGRRGAVPPVSTVTTLKLAFSAASSEQ